MRLKTTKYMRTGLTTSLVMSDAFKFLANWNVNVETQNRYQSKCHNFVKRKSLKNKNKNYYVVRNAGSAHSRYTLKLYLIFLINEWINQLINAESIYRRVICWQNTKIMHLFSALLYDNLYFMLNHMQELQT